MTYQAASKLGSCEDSLKRNSFFLVLVLVFGIASILPYFLEIGVGETKISGN